MLVNLIYLCLSFEILEHAMFLKYYVLTQTIQVPSLYVIVLQNVGHPTIAIGYQKYKTYTTENWLSYNSGFDYYQTQIGSRVREYCHN